MRRHHTGSGRRSVIPADWSAHHRPAANDTHTGTVQLRHAGGIRGTFDKTTGTWSTTPHPPYYAGPARIQLLPSETQEVEAAEQQVSLARYAVMLDADVTGFALEDICKVTAVEGNGDAWLVGRELTVYAFGGASLHWERRLLCTDSLETQEQ
ncbi:DUF6093 family protein [Nocardioides sp. SYSU D00065]|uniref:DUF6093 family protein n=1 Tax=Nocardioides sp. SYSU D00065 TaxID=2817378 RepID=UPI001B32EF94|nr:DUF6093 family protein [Nocardioides sp. SYSU D00065]